MNAKRLPKPSPTIINIAIDAVLWLPVLALLAWCWEAR
jgi:hypothetical protein